MHSLTRSIAVALLFAVGVADAAPWTYRGTLNDGGAPANGRYDLRLSLLDASGAKSLAYPLTFNGVEVKNGSFAIDVDFGFDLTQFGALRLKTEVGQGSSGFVALGEPKVFDPKATLAGVCWETQGNTGLTYNDFLGTNDDKPLVFKANGFRVATFETVELPSTNLIPTITLGDPDNYAPGLGATISGGGGDGSFENHYASGNFSVIAGGHNSIASGNYASVGGGSSNEASGYAATVVSGDNNCAGANYSLAMGFNAKARPAIDPGRAGVPYGCDGLPSYPGGNGDQGTFVWADSQNSDFISTNDNQFLVRADGGIGVNTNKLGNHPNLRLAELTMKNSSANGNTDLNLMTSNARGYSIAVVPDVGANAGALYIQELNAISTGEPTWTPRLIITASGQTQVQGGAVGSVSDARLKKNIAAIEHPLDTLLALRGHRFEYIDPAQALGASGTRIGFVAQEVQQVLPHWVASTSDGFYSVATSGFEALAVEAVREQQQEIDTLRSANTDLQQQLLQLAQRLALLESAQGQ